MTFSGRFNVARGFLVRKIRSLSSNIAFHFNIVLRLPPMVCSTILYELVCGFVAHMEISLRLDHWKRRRSGSKTQLPLLYFSFELE